MAQTHKSSSEKATETAKTAADRATDMARETTDNVKSLTARGAQNARTAAEGAVELQRSLAHSAAGGSEELGRMMVDAMREQTEHNLKTMTALYATVDWEQVMRAVDWQSVARVQGEFLRVSMMRAAAITRRYLEVSQSMMAEGASAMQRQAKKTA